MEKRNVTYQKERWCEIGVRIGSKGDWNLCMNWWWEWEIEVGKRGIFIYLFEFWFEFGNIYVNENKKKEWFWNSIPVFLRNEGFSDLLLTVLCSANLLLPLKREREREMREKGYLIINKTKWEHGQYYEAVVFTFAIVYPSQLFFSTCLFFRMHKWYFFMESCFQTKLTTYFGHG